MSIAFNYHAHVYVSKPHVRPRNFPGKNLPDDDTEAADATGVGSTLSIKGLSVPGKKSGDTKGEQGEEGPLVFEAPFPRGWGCAPLFL